MVIVVVIEVILIVINNVIHMLKMMVTGECG